jgi:predicted nucleic acid-binding protein
VTNGNEGQALPLVYLDTNFFVRGFETTTEAGDPVAVLLSRFRRSPGVATTSEFTLAELTSPSTNPAAIPFETRQTMYLDLLVWNRFIELQPVSKAVLLETSVFRKTAFERGYRPKLPDAIHIVTAFRAGCQFFLSEDGRIAPLLNGMVPLTTTAKDIAVLLKALDA